ncbi:MULTISPECIES: AraC family transcriptional regulator [Achromobacter]|uniref:AraC family transcriptional regulator n=1 Tax=Achromobacter spanius TaxID=217203 RepID=A0ABY8GUY1_9BURK|nr:MULTISPECIES: AraC family transcriptional regulator [Achromobacter]WAI82220.1 AraC family transcriptional regulator [Achromobacter spanius]WEX92308.1 AraC family transcriptional regulator [Achromobacter sp. SS2-2022]WFP08542.1 AraC family transcriptional regulator [Achromobacter spanius]
MAVSQHIWHCGAGLPGDVLIADLRAYRYAPHFHDAWSIGAVEHGRCAFTVHGVAHSAAAGDLVVIAPGQVHTGGTSDAPLAYRMAYIDAAWFDDHARAWFGAAARLAAPVITAPALCAQWLAALTPAAIPDSERRERISAALFGLLAEHGNPASAEHIGGADGADGAGRTDGKNEADVCALLRERMAADPACAPDLEALARAQDRHRTTLVKQFARRYGLPPQAWLRNWRVARARVLLRAGLPLAQAAQAVGFADQAHLTRVFKQVYGSTPGALLRADSQTLRARGVSIR